MNLKDYINLIEVVTPMVATIAVIVLTKIAESEGRKAVREIAR